jgi:hypothetical protein
MKAADLGTYVLYDQDGGYLVSDDGPLIRQTTLESDVTLIDDAYVSGAEWTLETSTVDGTQYQLRNRRNDMLLGVDALAAEGVPVSFEAAEGCKAYPELTLDATGEVTRTMFDDGDLYGIVDTHSHVHSNYAFGGGGLFHGGAYHRLGVEHALPDCSISHGEMGRKDFFGYIFDLTGNNQPDISQPAAGPDRQGAGRGQPRDRGLPRLHRVAERADALDPPDAVLPVAAAGLPRRPAPGGPARDDQRDHLRLHDRRGHPEEPLRLRRHDRGRPHHRRVLRDGALHRRAAGGPRGSGGSASSTRPAEAREVIAAASWRWSSASRPRTCSTAS